MAHAWNAGADRVPAEAVAALLAPTTAANSAWSPFHTFGGLVATTKRGFEDAPDVVRARRLVGLSLGPACRNPQVRAIRKGLMDVKEAE